MIDSGRPIYWNRLASLVKSLNQSVLAPNRALVEYVDVNNWWFYGKDPPDMREKVLFEGYIVMKNKQKYQSMNYKEFLKTGHYPYHFTKDVYLVTRAAFPFPKHHPDLELFTRERSSKGLLFTLLFLFLFLLLLFLLG
jgi:hypothetical protein